MAFNFSIFLLSCIIVHNSVSQPTDYKFVSGFMKTIFDFVIDYYSDEYNINKYIRKSQFLDFVGNDDHNLQCVYNYWAANSDSPEKEDKMYVKEFTEIVSLICEKLKIHKIDFLRKREKTAKVIKYAFDFAFEYYNHGIGRLYLHHLDFLLFVGKYDHLQCVQSYWTAKSIPSGQTELHLDEFTGLVNWISTKNNYVVEEFLEKRIAVAKVINDAYNLAYVHYGVVQEKGFSEFQFLDFVGKDITNELLVYHYWIANSIPPKNRGNIFFKEFADLVNLIIFKRYDLIKFINKRMEKISS